VPCPTDPTSPLQQYQFTLHTLLTPPRKKTFFAWNRTDDDVKVTRIPHFRPGRLRSVPSYGQGLPPPGDAIFFYRRGSCLVFRAIGGSLRVGGALLRNWGSEGRGTTVQSCADLFAIIPVTVAEQKNRLLKSIFLNSCQCQNSLKDQAVPP
jgi:hypothetical protein